jgi:tetratricopeptide (TPR) repeat protein
LSAAARLRLVLRGALVVALLLVAITVRVVTSAVDELRQGDALRARGELERAVLHYRRAARWYAPGSPFQREALTDLAAIGAAAEQRQDTELALSAYRAIHAAIMSTRSFHVPEQARLRAADARIASLVAAQPVPPIDAGKSRAQLQREHLALLTAERDPKLAWTLTLLLGFALWVASAFAFCARAINEHDRFVPREAMRWASLIALGLGLFVLGLALA